MPNYFTCTYGNFGQDNTFIKKSLEANYYILHKDARFPTALKHIKAGDVILLKNRAFIIAWGKALGCMQEDKDRTDGWIYSVSVETWHPFNPSNSMAGKYAYGISKATCIGGQMSVVKQVSPEWATAQLKDFNENVSNDEVHCENRTISYLLSQNLQIPSYQRGYCWREGNINKFLDDLIDGISLSSSDSNFSPYHMGTMIFKTSDTQGKESLDIIDGQQRLITLSILLFCIRKKEDVPLEDVPLLQQNIKDTENYNTQHQHFILQAKQTIDKWLVNKIGYEEKIAQIVQNVVICCITINKEASEDLAYRFFNATNATGKRLSDYDLLKTHHLRYVHDDLAAFAAGKWNKMQEEESRHLLNHTLYRLRNWSRNEAFDIYPDINSKQKLFHHYSVQYAPIVNMYCIPLPPQYNSSFNGGLDFFTYVENYKSIYNNFENIEYIKELDKHLAWHSNGTLHAGIKAITFLFYAKYGERYLAEALFCIAYRISILRNEPHVRRKALSTKPIFSELVKILDRSTTENIFFAYCQSEQYINKPEGSTKINYWKSLSLLLDFLRKNIDTGLNTNITINHEQRDIHGK